MQHMMIQFFTINIFVSLSGLLHAFDVCLVGTRVQYPCYTLGARSHLPYVIVLVIYLTYIAYNGIYHKISFKRN